MRRRIHVVLPDTQQCRGIVGTMLGAGLRRRDLHAAAAWWVDLGDLPRARAWQTTELLNGVVAGAFVGGTSGLAGILLALLFPAGGVVVGTVAMSSAVIAGAGYGSLFGALVAKEIPKRDLAVFRSNLRRGQILLLIDAPDNRMREITALLNAHCGDAFYTLPLRSQSEQSP